MKEQYTIRVEAGLLSKARKAAEKEMRSLNNFIEVSIAKHLDALSVLEELQQKQLDLSHTNASLNQEGYLQEN